jgi:hypothetical protein
MPSTFSRLIGLLLLASPAAAQTPAELLRPAQTIALGPHATVGGTVVLPNHNTVLLLTDSESPEIVVQCLAPDGHTLWKTTAVRFGHAVYGSGYLFDTRQIAIGQEARTNKQLQKEKTAASLYPVSVLTDGNEIVLAERISEEVAKDLVKSGATNLVEGQVYVQRLNAEGVLTKHLFEPRPTPASKETKALTMAGYADANGYVEVVREKNKEEGTLVFCTMHYDLKTNALRREKLELPATPEPPGLTNSFRAWYQEWAYLGRHANHTYFCRRTLVNDPSQKPGHQPITYQVYLVDDKGAPAPGGFRTTLDLDKGTIPMYSGRIPSYGELAHIPHRYTKKVGQGYVNYDEWETSSGGIGSFYLDRATGDVLIFGEYGKGDLPEADPRPFLNGFFERRYAADGRLVAQLQTPYTDEMRDKTTLPAFRGYYDRQPHFHFDPFTGHSQYGFAPQRGLDSNDDFDLFLDRDLKLQRYEILSGKGKDKDGRIYTSVWFTEPFWVYKVGGSAADLRNYEHAAPTDLPVYAALEKLRRTASADMPDYKFYLSPTGPSTGLVVEQPLGIGGALKVYTF